MSPVNAALTALETHMKRFNGQLLMSRTYGGDEFDRLYLAWIRTRWDANDKWTRSVWERRP